MSTLLIRDRYSASEANQTLMQFDFTLKEPESATDLLYLLRLCQYENEHRVSKLNMKAYAAS